MMLVKTFALSTLVVGGASSKVTATVLRECIHIWTVEVQEKLDQLGKPDLGSARGLASSAVEWLGIRKNLPNQWHRKYLIGTDDLAQELSKVKRCFEKKYLTLPKFKFKRQEKRIAEKTIRHFVKIFKGAKELVSSNATGNACQTFLEAWQAKGDTPQWEKDYSEWRVSSLRKKIKQMADTFVALEFLTWVKCQCKGKGKKGLFRGRKCKTCNRTVGFAPPKSRRRLATSMEEQSYFLRYFASQRRRRLQAD